jgi:hypothetical protein
MATNIPQGNERRVADAIEREGSLSTLQGYRNQLSVGAESSPSRLAGPFSQGESAYRVGESSSPENVEDAETRPAGRGSFAGIQEQWEDVRNLDARIIEVRRESVKVEVLIDREERRFQDRIFDRNLLESAVPLEEGAYLLIRRFKGKGKIKFTFENGNKYVRSKDVFEDKSRFQDLDDFDFDRDL